MAKQPKQEQELNEPKLSPETLKMVMNNPELAQYIADIRAISHNTSLRTYEMSILLDGILNLISTLEIANVNQIWNFTNFSGNIKEWHSQTNQLLTIEEYMKKFLPDTTLEDLKGDRYKVDIKKELDKYHAMQKTMKPDKNLN